MYSEMGGAGVIAMLSKLDSKVLLCTSSGSNCLHLPCFIAPALVLVGSRESYEYEDYEEEYG